MKACVRISIGQDELILKLLGKLQHLHDAALQSLLTLSLLETGQWSSTNSFQRIALHTWRIDL
jgi:hypothetical protein